MTLSCLYVCYLFFGGFSQYDITILIQHQVECPDHCPGHFKVLFHTLALSEWKGVGTSRVHSNNSSSIDMLTGHMPGDVMWRLYFVDGVWWLAGDVVESCPGAGGRTRRPCQPAHKAVDAGQTGYTALSR